MKQCIINECSSKHVARGYCKTYYNQFIYKVIRYDKTKTKRAPRNNQSKRPEYGIWSHIKYRCSNPRAREYKWYGGRGITMHKTWVNDFEQFFKDVGSRLSPELTLDRINNDGNYEPGNTRWVSFDYQANNRRITKRNTTGTAGVMKSKKDGVYIVSIGVDSKKIYIGRFRNLEDAVIARENAEIKYKSHLL